MSLSEQARAILKSLDDCKDAKSKEELIYNILIKHESKIEDLKNRNLILCASRELERQKARKTQATLEKRLRETQDMQAATKKRLREARLSNEVLASAWVQTSKRARF